MGASYANELRQYISLRDQLKGGGVCVLKGNDSKYIDFKMYISILFVCLIFLLLKVCITVYQGVDRTCIKSSYYFSSTFLINPL